jgi:hypothetical protein
VTGRNEGKKTIGPTQESSRRSPSLPPSLPASTPVSLMFSLPPSLPSLPPSLPPSPPLSLPPYLAEAHAGHVPPVGPSVDPDVPRARETLCDLVRRGRERGRAGGRAGGGVRRHGAVRKGRRDAMEAQDHPVRWGMGRRMRVKRDKLG